MSGGRSLEHGIRYSPFMNGTAPCIVLSRLVFSFRKTRMYKMTHEINAQKTGKSAESSTYHSHRAAEASAPTRHERERKKTHTSEISRKNCLSSATSTLKGMRAGRKTRGEDIRKGNASEHEIRYKKTHSRIRNTTIACGCGPHHFGGDGLDVLGGAHEQRGARVKDGCLNGGDRGARHIHVVHLDLPVPLL